MANLKFSIDGREPISPLFNAAFVRVFGREESKNVTRDLVNSLLEYAGVEQIGEVERITAESTMLGGGVECKSSRMDVKVVSADGQLVDLESERRDPDFNNRFLFYAAKIIANSIRSGDDYNKIPRVTVIVLYDVKKAFPDSESFVSTGSMMWHCDDEIVPGSDKLRFVMVELKKFSEAHPYLDDTVLSNRALTWLYLLTNGYLHEEEVETMMKTLPPVEEFAELYGFALDDPQLASAYDLAWSAYMTDTAWIQEETAKARAKGMAEGRAQGMAEGRAEVLAQLVADGLLSEDALASYLEPNS